MAVDERRTKPLNDQAVGDGPVLYVMGRDQRVQHNWPLLFAKERAQAREVPYGVLFVVGPMFNHGTKRHNEWLVASLKEVAEGLAEKNIPFFVETADSWAAGVTAFVKRHGVGEVVFDQNPLEPIRSWRDEAAKALPVLVTEVDGRNVVPVWEASDKTEFAAHTLRPKIHKKLREFLTDYPNLVSQKRAWPKTVPEIDWKAVAAFRKFVHDAPVPDTFTPGEAAGRRRAQYFIDNVLEGYVEKRNDPNEDALSDLSPYLRWGNVSAQFVAKQVQDADVPKADRDAFIEELIVRRELSDNYVYFTKGYDTLDGAHEWAQKTLQAHRDDEREHVYTFEEFEQAKTHDELWNAMQRQMVTEGKMHGWCRMYWAKKILEWTNTPEYAIKVALTLNDRYELDGRESNGVVGVMWSIAGVHDRAWTERPVYGKIRYMNYNGAKRKFDVEAYIDRYKPQDSLFND